MTRNNSLRIQIYMLTAAFALLLLGCQTMPGDTTSGNGTTTGSGNTGGNSAKTPRLFVVNNGATVDSYANAEAASGDVTPATNLVNLEFQPSAVAVTRTGQLLEATASGIFIYDNATTVTGNGAANRLVKGDNTLLISASSVALDAANDRIFVGNDVAPNGILVFDNVSSTAFNGNVAPARTFNPPDRSPTVFNDMPISALALDSGGSLYVAEAATPGEGFNTTGYLPDRLLVFASPGTASGPTIPTRTLTSSTWSHIANLAVDRNDVLYVVNDSDTVFIFKKASTLNGSVTPDATLTVPKLYSSHDVNLRGIVIASDGRGFVSDENSGAIYSYANIATRSGTAAPDATMAGLHTELFTPGGLFLVEP